MSFSHYHCSSAIIVKPEIILPIFLVHLLVPFVPPCTRVRCTLPVCASVCLVSPCQLIVDCVEELPHKAPFYVTLVSAACIGQCLHQVIACTRSMPAPGHCLHQVIACTWSFPAPGHCLHQVNACLPAFVKCSFAFLAVAASRFDVVACLNEVSFYGFAVQGLLTCHDGSFGSCPLL